jgi:phosphonate transport system substrate-binding protein
MKKFVLALIALVMAAVMSLSLVAAQDATPDPAKADWPSTFIIGVYPGDNIQKALDAQEPLRAYLESKLGVHTVVVTGTSYGTVIEAMRAGRADAFEVGPLSYLIANNVANAEALVVGNYSKTVDKTILPGYFSVLFTKKGSGIKSIADLAGKSFAFTDPASTSGFLMPSLTIMSAQSLDAKDQLDSYLGESVFAGSHPASVLAVWNSTADAGATFDDNLVSQANGDAAVAVCGIDKDTAIGSEVFHSAMTQEAIDKIYADCPDGNIAVFAQSVLIPQTPFAINKDLPQSFKDAVKQALLEIADDQTVVDALGRFYVDPTTLDTSLTSVDAYYNNLREAARRLGVDVSTNG